MHGAALVTTEKVVCLSAVPADVVVDRLDSWTDEHGLEFAVVPVGESLPAGATADSDRTLGVTVGGDGTFLEAVRAFAPHGIPVASVNRGTLSFLSRIPPEVVTDAMSEILRGEASVFDRQRLHVDGGGFDATAVNDVTFEPLETIDRRPTCRLDVFVDDEYVGAYDGGGLCVSTPTGSTAMALSAGGPVHHPADNGTLQLTALHHDGLGVRPVVLDAGRTISVVPLSTVRVWVDGGRTVKSVRPGRRLQLTGAARPARVVRTSYETSFLAALATKLGWTIRGRTPPTLDPPAHPRGIDVTLLTDDDDDDGSVGAFARWAGHDERPDWLTGERQPRPGWLDEEAQLRTGWLCRSGRPGLAGGPERHRGSTWGRTRSNDLPPRAVDVAVEAVSAAGEFLERYFRRITRATDREQRGALVDDADQGSERILTAVVASAFSDHAIQCEGQVYYRGQSTYTWLFDPLDGHTNFEHGNPNYCTTIALLEDGVPVVGVVYAPAADELFYGVRGGGAYRNGAPIESTDRERLDESMLVSGYDPDGQFLETLYPHTRGVRRLGSQALNLCYVAAGSADALWEYDTYPWDVAAGLCILRAAGGRATDADGTDYRLRLTGGDRTPLLASNGPLHPTLLELLARETP